MTQRLLTLTDTDLSALADALQVKRLCAPYGAVAVGRFVASELAEPIAVELQQLAWQGFSADQLAIVIQTLLADRGQRPPADDMVDLVTTGPEAPGCTNRDTSVVVRELFANAIKSVMVVGFAVYQGQQVFRALADRMLELPDLLVRMYLDIQRGPGDTSAPSELVRRFVDRFKTRQWPTGYPFPSVYFDPRSLASAGEQRTSLHAKCIVVDRQRIFVSSANFTEAAQQRNIEVGLLAKSALLAEQLERHFESLAEAGLLERAI